MRWKYFVTTLHCFFKSPYIGIWSLSAEGLGLADFFTYHDARPRGIVLQIGWFTWMNWPKNGCLKRHFNFDFKDKFLLDFNLTFDEELLLFFNMYLYQQKIYSSLFMAGWQPNPSVPEIALVKALLRVICRMRNKRNEWMNNENEDNN